MSARHRTITLNSDMTAGQALRTLAPNDAAAIPDGRLFVERRRVMRPEEPLTQGQSVTLYEARQPLAAVGPDSLPKILGERMGIVALSKPAAWSSEPDKTGNATSLTRFVSEQLGLKEVHIATRLDVGVSGLVLATTHAVSRKHLTQLMESGQMHRTYVAIAEGRVQASGRWQGAVETKPGEKARAAVTDFELVGQVEINALARLVASHPISHASLVRLRPQTGRRHQLRIHAQRGGHPLLGDRRYGGSVQCILPNGRVVSISRIMLAAVATSVPLLNGEVWSIHCPVDAEVGGLWELLGGKHDDFSK